MVPFLLAGALLILPPEPPPIPAPVPAPENLIAPLPAEALRSSSVMKGTLSTFGNSKVSDGRRMKAPAAVSLRPDQSLMGMIQAPRPDNFNLRFSNKFLQPLIGCKIFRVGGKVFLINNLNRQLDVACEVTGVGNLFNEPYELVLCEIDTEKALLKNPELRK